MTIMQLYFYADVESVSILEERKPKALLIGSDFGYGNFGDVLQHKGAIAGVRSESELAVVSIFSLNAISRHVDMHSLRSGYGVDALLFVSPEPIETGRADKLGLRLQEIVRDVAFVQLYGGGFLNEMWGDFVLGVAEYFLQRVPNVTYLISGQQVSPGYAQRVVEHITTYKPILLGVRDHDSQAALGELGVHAEFSFDDATEQLLALNHMLQLQPGAGVFVHLNSSGYTGNDEALQEIRAHMQIVADRVGSRERPVLLQAFQDAREEVLDTVETVKRLETGFPFIDTETVLLVAAILGGGKGATPRKFTGGFGYSCSYHVTLWLQLSGIPCWLRGSNAYYDQKRKALGIEGTFVDFLERMPRPDHGRNLKARAEWIVKLGAILGGIKAESNRVELNRLEGAPPARAFNYKGEPRLETRLNETWAAVCGFREDAERLSRQLDEAVKEEAAMQEQLQTVSLERDALMSRLGDAEDRYRKANSDLERASGELRAVSAQLDRRIAEQEGLNARLLETTAQLAATKVETARKDAVIAEVECRLGEASEAAAVLERRLVMAEQSEGRLVGRVDALSAQVTSLGAECWSLATRLRDAEAGWWLASQGNEQLSASLAATSAEKDHVLQELEITRTRLLACQEQLTMVGGEARHYREQADWANIAVQQVSAREREASERLGAIERSRSWRWTRPGRALLRYLRTGRFDSAGNIGLFEMVRIVGRRVPMPVTWRSALGRKLQKLRRR